MDLSLITNIFKTALTESNDKSYCFAKLSSSAAILAFLVGTAFDVYSRKTFDFAAFSSGMMQLLAGSGLLLGAKQVTDKPST